MDFGEAGLKEHTMMLGYSTPMLPPINTHMQQQSVYHRHELLKRNAYEQRIREVEHASFTPLVMSLTGDLGPAATTTYKRRASLLSTKWNQPHGKVMAWLCCCLSFSLLRSSIMCIRGAHSSQGHVQKSLSTAIDAISKEAISSEAISSEALVAH